MIDEGYQKAYLLTAKVGGKEKLETLHSNLYDNAIH